MEPMRMMQNPMMNPMNMPNPMGMPFFVPHFGLGPNDSMNMFNNMLNIFNNNSFNNPTSTTGTFPGPRNRAPSPFIFQDEQRNRNLGFNNNMNNIMNNPMMDPFMNPMMMNMNLFMNNINNNNFIPFNDFSLDKKDLKRDENLDVKMDVDNILKNRGNLDSKNKDVQYILNYIPFTVIKDAPKSLDDEPRCLICLCDFEVGEKVSALPCCHCFHTKCLDEWIVRNAKCPICKFEITLKNLIGEDIIKEHMKRIEEAKKEEERKEKERKEKERIEKEKKEKERKEKERLERERKEKQRKEKERQERERKEKERLERERKEKERKEKERKERERKEKERREKERLERERKEKERKAKEEAKKKSVKTQTSKKKQEVLHLIIDHQKKIKYL